MVEVLVPCTNVTKLGVGGKRVVKPEKLMPGYVLLNMHMDKVPLASLEDNPMLLCLYASAIYTCICMADSTSVHWCPTLPLLT